MRVVVTGAAGMIGSNIAHALAAAGVDDIIAVDDLRDGMKFRNLLGAPISDYFDQEEFYGRFARGELGQVTAVFHQGACSDTMQHDGRLMLQNNYRCSRELLQACQEQGVRLIYASSAAIYGSGSTFLEQPLFERPLNVYGYSKLLFDDVVRRMLASASSQAGSSQTATSQVVGLRYFNVYGPREQHKGRMASVAFHHFNQYRDSGKVRLFGAYGGYAAGEQERDFIHVDDVVAVNLWFLAHPQCSGVFNLGTGRAQTFNEVAHATVNGCRAARGEPALTLAQQIEQGLVEYIPFPEALVGKYQCHTQADLTALRAAGVDHQFANVATGVRRYVEWLSAASAG
jgi:ADP-L-glycero-D-manno-heptose 6-epimerase